MPEPRGRRVTTQPSYASGGIAVVAALCATALGTGVPLQRTVVGIEGIGLLVLLAGSALRQRGRRVGGLVLVLAGSAITSLSLGLGAVFPVGVVERSALLAGMLGSALLALAVYPLSSRWAQHLAGLGPALVLGGVVVRRWLEQTGQLHLLVAVALTVLTWDAAGQAITLGNDVGRGTRTWAVSTTHAAGSLAVGVAAVAVASGIYGVAPSGIPLAALALLLGALAVLLVSLYLGDFD